MKKLALICLVLALSPIAEALAENTLPRTLRVAATSARWHADKDFRAEIDEAKSILDKREAGYTLKTIVGKTIKIKVKKKVTFKKLPDRSTLDDFYILLAVKHRSGKNIEVVRVSKDGDNDDGYEIDWAKANGLNTNFILSKPDGYTVLAAKRVIRSGKKAFKEAVYAPYTADIDTRTMRQAGLTYLESTLTKAYQELLEKQVRSHAVRGKTIAETVPREVALMLALIEHIDPARFKKEAIESLINQELVTVAANREMSYAFAVSKAGARGLFQFIPRTYAAIVRAYPEAGLIPDFVAGMNDHVNAAKASLLLFDADVRHVPSEKRLELIKDPDLLGEYLAAAYNGGAPRAVKALVSGGWEYLKIPETRVYIEKLLKVRKTFRS